MCTALCLTAGDHYFGRNLDLDRSYGEEVCVMPRRFPLSFRQMPPLPTHYAMIGMAAVVSGIPLFYEATNEHGLSMAGLNFPGNAHYAPLAADCDNIAPFAFIPWILARCKTVADAEPLLARLNLADIPFSADLPLSPLHWIIADRTRAVTVEAMRDGLHVYDNPTGVLTNNPPFPQQLANLAQYRHLRPDNAGIRLAEDDLPYTAYCQGLGAVGLPGDLSSMSRFVRIAFGRTHSACADDEPAAVGQFFHLLASVAMARGSCVTDDGHHDITVYSACTNTDRGRYYYTTYDNQQITCVDMQKTDLDSNTLHRFPLTLTQNIAYAN